LKECEDEIVTLFQNNVEGIFVEGERIIVVELESKVRSLLVAREVD